MTALPIKFRCYRCNQLLGVARSKAGEVVACPKCAAELVVPEPSEATSPDPSDSGARSVSSSPASAGSLASGLELKFLDIRPSDLRAEPGALDGFAAVNRDEPAEAPTVGGPARGGAARAGPVQSAVEPDTAEAIVLPPIQIEAPTLKAAPRPATPRPRDLTLPRTVVTAWSLLVLLALAFAFLAGLLAGHYVWRVHG